MLALEAMGVRLRVYSQLDPGEPIAHADVHRLRGPVTYLPSLAPSGIARLLWANLRTLWRSPRRYWRAARHALSRSDALASLKHLLRGGWLGYELERMGVNHLHAHFAHGPAATAQYAHQLYGIPYSFTGHAKDIFTTPQTHIAERLREARFVVTCTAYNQRYLSALVDTFTAQRIHCVYHGVDRTRFHPLPVETSASSSRGDPTVPLILAVGRLVEKKGLSYLIQACQALACQGQSFRCVIVGSGPLEAALQTEIAHAQLADRVTLYGACTQDTLVHLYREATVVVLPSVRLANGDQDGIPNVLVEAMSMGTPVVSTTISGISELVIHQQNGLLVPPRDADALATALMSLLSDHSLRQRLGQAAQATVERDFDLARNTRYLSRLFTQELKKHPSNALPPPERIARY